MRSKILLTALAGLIVSWAAMAGCVQPPPVQPNNANQYNWLGGGGG